MSAEISSSNSDLVNESLADSLMVVINFFIVFLIFNFDKDKNGALTSPVLLNYGLFIRLTMWFQLSFPWHPYPLVRQLVIVNVMRNVTVPTIKTTLIALITVCCFITFIFLVDVNVRAGLCPASFYLYPTI